ncbi:MAG: hypothetical protein JRJ29_17165 [Deltaproteobacteria bacterium]|nr:hypothetical protein [Deltaproteobacteria bacterium]
MRKKADIGIIGLAVMGENLVLNMESKGFTVAVYNRTLERMENFLNGRGKGKNIVGCRRIEEFVANLERPRKVMMMVKAGAPVDECIAQVLPHIEDGDILIDGGNSYFLDTMRRTRELEEKGILFVGTGVCGGEEGALKEERIEASKVLEGPTTGLKGDPGDFIEAVRRALYASKICSYAQGYQLLAFASKAYSWDLKYGEIALLWRNGCIIRARFLERIKEAFDNNPTLPNLLLDPFFKNVIDRCQNSWRKTIATAVQIGIPVPAFGSALAYYDSYRAERLPADLLQAQRDYFGAHTYERVDKPRGTYYHTDWHNLR